MERKIKKLFKDNILMCTPDENGNINCKMKPIDNCKTVKETGIGIHGPILNIKRVCPANNLKDAVMQW